MVPQVEHVIPTTHHTVLHGIGHLQHGAALAGLVTHHQVLKGGNKRSSAEAEASVVLLNYNLTLQTMSELTNC